MPSRAMKSLEASSAGLAAVHIQYMYGVSKHDKVHVLYLWVYVGGYRFVVSVFLTWHIITLVLHMLFSVSEALLSWHLKCKPH